MIKALLTCTLNVKKKEQIIINNNMIRLAIGDTPSFDRNLV